MAKGFFSLSSIKSQKPSSGIAKCGMCKLYKNCITPRMPVTGEGKKKILIVAEAPGRSEDEKGIQLIGKAGRFLRRNLKRLKIDLDRDCWKTNAIICRPPNNATPTDEQITACRPNLIKTIKTLKPNLIIPLGGAAIKSLLVWLWKDDIGAMGRWTGWQIPCQKPNVWVCPTYHPSYCIRMNDNLINRFFYKHLEKAIRKSKNPPWKTLPNYDNKIEIIMEPAKAANIILQRMNKTKCIAFDYETNSLKPDYKGTEIVSCSICFDGKSTIAFPFVSDTQKAVKKLLKKPIPKIAANLKYEDRWTKKHLNINVRKWYWDTMLAAHIIDNRKGVTGLKFQSFVLIGMGSYDEHIEPYLKSYKNKLNRVRDINMRDLLLYNGLDSLLEYKVAMKQIKLLEGRK